MVRLVGAAYLLTRIKTPRRICPRPTYPDGTAPGRHLDRRRSASSGGVSAISWRCSVRSTS